MKLLIFVALAAAFAVGCSKPDDTEATPPPKNGAVTGTKGAASGGTVTPALKAPGNVAPDKFASVQPILITNCMPCHASSKPKAGINLTSYESVMKGGREGAIVKAGDPDGSKIDMALHGKGAKQMPPKGPLAPADIAKIETWIKAGAKNT